MQVYFGCLFWDPSGVSKFASVPKEFVRLLEAFAVAPLIGSFSLCLFGTGFALTPVGELQIKWTPALSGWAPS